MTSNGGLLTHVDVERIVRLVEDGEFGYVRLESGGLKLTLVREGYVDLGTTVVERNAEGPVSAEPPAGSRSLFDLDPPAVDAELTEVLAQGFVGRPDVPRIGPTELPGGASPVLSPVAGIFYLSPSPGSPAYVEIGQVLEPDSTVGLVEVMKMFTAVRAEHGGRVVSILVENGQQVDRDQVLLHVVDV